MTFSAKNSENFIFKTNFQDKYEWYKKTALLHHFPHNEQNLRSIAYTVLKWQHLNSAPKLGKNHIS